MRSRKIKLDRSIQENELSKLRRAIEDQRLKAERVELGKTHNGGTYSYSGNAQHNSGGSPEPESTYPVFVSPDHDTWTSATSTVSGHTLSITSGATLTRNNVDNLSPNSPINKRVSSGSLSSVSSHISGSSSSTGSSGPEIEAAMKQGKKKRWLPLKSAFSKGSKSQSSSQPDLLDSEDSGCPLSPTLGRRVSHHNGSVGSSSESEAIQELLQIVQEKERKLTDIRLEALTSQHQIHQLREQITQMQNEMQLLRLENERLQGENSKGRVTNSSSDDRLFSPPYGSPSQTMTLARTASAGLLSGNGTIKTHRGGRSLSCNQSPVTSPLHRPHRSDSIPTAFSSNFPTLDCHSLHSTLSPGSENDGFQVKFIVTSSSTMLPGKRSVVIGSLPVPRRATWVELDRLTQGILTEYCRVIDGDARMGLSNQSIESYNVGDLKREIGGKTPELLPCAYIVGEVDTVKITLRDASTDCADQMAFDMLIAKDTLECYLSLLMQNRRVILQGPTGTGKSAFAMSLAEYAVARLRAEGGNTMVAVMDASQDGEENLQRYLAELGTRSKTVESPSVPAVLVVKNLHLMTSLTNTLQQLMSITSSDGVSPFIIGTMQSGDGELSNIHEDFRTISCRTGSPHVQRHLTRALRRSLVEHLLTSSQSRMRENGKLSSIVLWIPLCWQHINSFLESIKLQYASLGPNIFLRTPMNVTMSCSWFVGIWNNSIIPYLASALREARSQPRNASWEDPTKWLISSFPWDVCETGIDPNKALSKLRSQDLEKLPTYPQGADTVDGDLDDLPLPPPPMQMTTSYSEQNRYAFRQPRAASSPIKANLVRNNENSAVRIPNIHNGKDGIWQRKGGSQTLGRSSPSSASQNRHYNTITNGSTKYSNGEGVKRSSSNDPLKDMLAQLKQAALNPSDDYDSALSSHHSSEQF